MLHRAACQAQAAGRGDGGEQPRARLAFIPPPGQPAAFDDSDLLVGCDVVDCRQPVPKLSDFMVAVPNQLLLVSLLEHLCFVYERNPHRSVHLFKLLCRKLADVRLISPLAFSDEFSTVRLQHKQAFMNLLQVASNGLCVQGHATNGDVQPKIPYRNREMLFQQQTSRYMSEFEEITSLGKGSYGKVYKVRNKLDGQFYALKKILMKKFTRLDCMKVLREVKVLAGLQHPHIVGYHTAWIEHGQPPVLKSNQVPLSNLCPLKGSSVQRDGRDPTDQNTQTSGSSIVFAEPGSARVTETWSGSVLEEMLVNSSKENVKQIHGEGHGLMPLTKGSHQPKGRKDFSTHIPCLSSIYTSVQNDTDLSSELQICQGRRNKLVEVSETEAWDKGIGSSALEISSSSVNLSSNSTSESDPSITDVFSVSQINFQLVLHIQMQLGEESLQDWISERNSRPREELAFTSLFSLVKLDCTLQIFRQLLEGVRFIHSKGVIHRDLKPRNIFLHAPDFHVRIGDFGLACSDIIETSDTWKSKTKGPYSKHTSGVGTCLYASPEQLEGSQYDFKSDMYSVGIILLELFHPFGTVMERATVITALREGHIPEDFARQWPVQAKYIKMLTSKFASLRPSADEMLSCELFCPLKVTPEQKLVTQEQEIKCLQQKVVDQEEEIRQLKEQVKLLARERGSIQRPSQFPREIL